MKVGVHSNPIGLYERNVGKPVGPEEMVTTSSKRKRFA